MNTAGGLRPLSKFFRALILLFVIFAGPASFSESRHAALMIIDMQPGFADRLGREKDSGNAAKLEALLKAQKRAIAAAEKARLPIVFIEYENHGETMTELKEAVKNYPRAATFRKSTDGAFDDSNRGRADLDRYLKQQRVDTLILAGANGGACVEQTMLGALKAQYNVIAEDQAIADFNYDDFIYPYPGYGMVIPQCAGCTFRDVPTVDALGTLLEGSGQTRSEHTEKAEPTSGESAR